MYVFLVQSHEKQACSQAQLPGSAPKNTLSSTALLSKACLPPVHLKLATSVPLAILTPAKHPVQNLKTSLDNGQAVPPPHLRPQNHDFKAAHSLCCMQGQEKDQRGLQQLMAHKQNI